MFFVSVHGDLDEPVVLREVRRFADDLRAQPGVANAWSIADLFLGVTFEGQEASGIPDDPEELRRILVQAETDPAVRLELSADRREALIGVRFDDDPTVDRLAIVAHAERYIQRELRHAMARIDLSAAATPPVARLVGAGILADDARDRVLRICARSGRTLNRAEALSVERVARAAALIPAADPPRLEAEVADAVRNFATHHPWPLGPQEIERLILGANALATDAAPDDVRTVVAAVYGARLPEPMLNATAAALARRISAVQKRHTARLDFKEMLYGADLPTEGVLADEVRSATLEAMGPVVGDPRRGRGERRVQAGRPADRRRAQRPGALRAVEPGAAGRPDRGRRNDRDPADAGGRAGWRSPRCRWPSRRWRRRSPPRRSCASRSGLPMISFFAGALAGGALLALIVTPSRGSGAAPRDPARRAIALGACAGGGAARPPGRSARRSTASPSIPPTAARPTPAEARETAARARAAGQPVIELGALAALERSCRLDAVLRAKPTAPEYERLADLLLARAAAFHDLGPRRSPRAAISRRWRASIRRAAAGSLPRARGRGGRRGRRLEGHRRPRRRARRVRAGGPALAACRPGAADTATAGACRRSPTHLPADLERWVLGGPALSARLVPLAAAFPAILDDVPRALRWADLLLDEDPSSPDVLELVAPIFGRAGRFGGTERMLMELTLSHARSRGGPCARGRPSGSGSGARAKPARSGSAPPAGATSPRIRSGSRRSACARQRSRRRQLAGDPRLRPRPRPPRSARRSGRGARRSAAARRHRRTATCGRRRRSGGGAGRRRRWQRRWRSPLGSVIGRD